MSLKNEIIYRSLHRGCKETDHLIGKFVAENIDNFSQNELLILKDLIIEDDLLIYDWILGKISPFEKYEELILKMRKFHNI